VGGISLELTMSILQALNLCKCYAETVALESLTLSVEAGEVVCLLGANGAGKSTTLNLFLGFLQASSGEALVDGIRVQSDPAAARAKLGYLPEVVQFYPQLTGLETLRFFAELTGRAGTSSQALRETLAQAGLAEDAHCRVVATYSKGMRQKLGLAIALGKQARGFLLDEPLSGLDPHAANELITVVRQLANQGAAVLAVTHDIFRAQQMADRIGIMRQGRLVEVLPAAQMDAREIEALYIHHLRDVA